MLFPEIVFSELPAFIVIASSGNDVISHGHTDTLGAALSWCGRAMDQLPDADQIAISKPTLECDATFGKTPAILVIEGWQRHAGAWRCVDARQLRDRFGRVPGGPRTLLTTPPARDASTPAENGPIQRSLRPSTPASLANEAWNLVRDTATRVLKKRDD